MTKPTIPFSDWDKIDLRVGKILHVEDHPQADKLYVLKVDLGTELGERTIVAGLKKHYTKEELKGRSGIFIANLEPVKLRGINSEGMTLAAVSDDDTTVLILTPDHKSLTHLEPGSKIR